jgi:hypothetical protein
MPSRSEWRRLIYRWHRRIGLAASVLLLVLAVTGMLLNHSERLGLDGAHVRWSPLLDWYGLAPEHPPQGYRLGKQWLVLLEGQAYLDGKPVADGLGKPAGAVALPPGFIIAGGQRELALLTADGQLVERLGPASLPGSPQRLGVAGLLVQALLPWFRHRDLKRVVAISAKVGSIEDNRLGGWYAYRSSKAALNMLVRTLSVELPRRCKPIACVSLHPGTTDSALSDPFSQSLAQLQVHSPEETAGNLMSVIEGISQEDNGRFLSWDGSALPW